MHHQLFTAAGGHAVIATYQGDGNFTGSSSSTLALTVRSPQDRRLPGNGQRRARAHERPDRERAITCTGATTCTVKLTLTVIETIHGNHVVAVTASKHKHRVVDLGSIMTTIAAGHRKTIQITLNRLGKQLLPSHHKLSVKLTLTQTASGKIRTIARTLAFKAPKTRAKTRR